MWKDRIYSLAEKGIEISSTGIGDYRPTNLEITDANDNKAVRFEYVSHQIVKGIVKSDTMPYYAHLCPES